MNEKEIEERIKNLEIEFEKLTKEIEKYQQIEFEKLTKRAKKRYQMSIIRARINLKNGLIIEAYDILGDVLKNMEEKND